MQDMAVLRKMKDIFEIIFEFTISHEKREVTHEKNGHNKHFFYRDHLFYDGI